MANNEASLLIKIKQVGGEVLDKFVITLGDVAEGVKKVGEFLYSFIEAYAEQEKAVNALTQTMVKNGIYTTELRKTYEDYAAAIQKTTQYGDEEVISAENILQARLGQKQVTMDLLKATTDLATGQKIDLASAAEMVAKAMGTQNNTLKRMGIQYNETSDSGERMGRIIEAINQKFGGQAVAATQGLGGVKQMQNAWSDFQETVGQRLSPLFNIAVKALTTFFEGLAKGGPILDDVVRGIYQVSAQAVLFGRDFEVIGKTIGTVFAGLAETMWNYVKGDYKKAWESAKNTVNVTLNDIESANKKAYDKIAEMDRAYMEGKQGNLEKEAELEKQAMENKKTYRKAFDEDAAKEQVEKSILKQNLMIQEQEMEGQNEAQKAATQVKMLDEKMAKEENYQTKLQMVKDRAALIEKQKAEIAKAQRLQIETTLQTGRADIIGASADLITAIGDKESKAVFLISKAAALAQTYISTQVAAAQALAAPPGPPFTIPLAANVETLGYIRMAAIGATAIKGLAQGGIVSGASGGGLYNIGEAGKDEAVIPLDDPATKEKLGLGGGVSVHFHGPVLGDENQARQFAEVIDVQLMKLRQSGSSLSMESTF